MTLVPGAAPPVGGSRGGLGGVPPRRATSKVPGPSMGVVGESADVGGSGSVHSWVSQVGSPQAEQGLAAPRQTGRGWGGGG